MRTDDQRDLCIDELLSRVNALEAEVARLKGEGASQAVAASPPAATSSAPGTEAEAFPEEFIFDDLPPADSDSKAGLGTSDDHSLENLIGTRWIGRIGVVAILFGVAFFLKYSFDNKLIGETGRVILGIFWGSAFIGAGEYLQKKRTMALYGQMLSGGGLAVLYLSLYAAFAFYHLLAAPVAMAAMVAVTSTGLTLSVRYSAFSLAALALLGGFLTPAMLSTGQNQPYTLFGYILLLDAGTVLLLRFRRWPSLVTASLVGSVILYVSWHAEFFDENQRLLAFGISAVFFVFYNLHVLLSSASQQEREAPQHQMVIWLSAAFFFLAFFFQQECERTWLVKSFTVALAACEIGLAQIMSRRGQGARLSFVTYAVVSVVMTVIATCVALEREWLSAALAAEMVALGWMALRLCLPTLRYGAVLLAVVVILRFADDLTLRLEPFERFTPIINGRFLVCAAAIAGFYLLAAVLWRYGERLVKEERTALMLAFIVSQLMSLALLSAEVHDFFRFRSPDEILGWGASHYGYQLSLSVLWAVYASVLVGIGILKRVRGARFFGILLLGVTILKVFLLDLSELQTFYRIISFIVLGLLLLAVSYSYNRFKHFIFGEEP